MVKLPFTITNLENHQTKNILTQDANGSLTVIWRDWDEILLSHPKMIYITSVYPGEIKGPHIHKLRTSSFICISGKVVFVIKDQDGKYFEISVNADTPTMITVPNNIASAHKNLHQKTSKILVLADIAWKPNDNEMMNVDFDDYDWSKWDKN